jgi:hypothetical protein
MQMRPDMQITAMLTAMTDVIIPALDPDNRLATEQANIVAGMLQLMARQMPLQFRFDRDELQRLTDAAGQIAAICGADAKHGAILEQLAEAQTNGETVLALCQGDPAALVAASRSLRRQIGAVMTEIGAMGGDPEQCKAVERVILQMSHEQLLRDRALLSPQGWETDPEALPKIETLLAPA